MYIDTPTFNEVEGPAFYKDRVCPEWSETPQTQANRARDAELPITPTFTGIHHVVSAVPKPRAHLDIIEGLGDI